MTMKTVAEYVDTVPESLRAVAAQLTAIIDAGLPHATSRVYHGHPVWLDATPVAGYKAYSKHVTFMLWAGQDIDDPTGRLQATGSQLMASVRLTSVDDVDKDTFAAWLAQTT